MTNTKATQCAARERKRHRRRSSLFSLPRSPPTTQPPPSTIPNVHDLTPPVKAARSSSSSRKASTASPLMTAYLTELPSPSPPPPRQPPLKSTGPTTNTGTNPTSGAAAAPQAKTRARSAAAHGVSFSPSTRFDACRQRGNIAVAREEFDNARWKVLDTEGEWRVLASAAYRAAMQPADTASGGKVGHRLIRTDAMLTGRRRASDQSTAALPPDRPLTPVKPSLPTFTNSSSRVPDSSLKTVDVNTSSPLGKTLLSKTMQPSQLPDSASPRSPVADALDMSLSVTHELPRADRVCLRAAAPTADAPTLAARLIFGGAHNKHSGSGGERRRSRSRPRSEDTPSAVAAKMPAVAEAAAAAATSGERDGSSLRPVTSGLDRRYLVEVSAPNFASVAANALRAEEASRRAAVPFGASQQPLRKTGSGVDASTQSLYSMLNINGRLLSGVDEGDRRGGFGATAAALPLPPSTSGLTVELLKEQVNEYRQSTPVRSRDAVASVTEPQAAPEAVAVAAETSALPQQQDSAALRSLSSLFYPRSSGTSFGDSSAHSFSTKPLQRHDTIILPVPPPNKSSDGFHASGSRSVRRGSDGSAGSLGPTPSDPHGKSESEAPFQNHRRTSATQTEPMELVETVATRPASSLSHPPAAVLAAGAAATASGVGSAGASPTLSWSRRPLLTPLVHAQRGLLPATPLRTPLQAPHPITKLPSAATSAGPALPQQLSPLSFSAHHPALTPFSQHITQPGTWLLATPENSSQDLSTAMPSAGAVTRTWEETRLRTPNKAAITPNHPPHIPSPLAPLPTRSPRRSSAVSIIVPEARIFSAANTPIAARVPLPQLTDDGSSPNERRITEEKR